MPAIPHIRKVALACAALLAAAQYGTAAAADIPKDKAELNQEVMLRCIYDMSEFGDDAVQTCVRADLAAAEALTQYPAEVQPVVDRCFRRMWTRGYGVVQVCVEQDLKAASALATYGAEHAQTIQSCQAQVGQEGPAKVQRCVEAALAGKQPGAR